MVILSINDVLESVSEFVDKCLGPLGSNGFSNDTLRDLIIQVCATIILFLVVRFFLWKPITNILETRSNKMSSDLKEAEEKNLLARKLTVDLENKLIAAQKEIKELVERAESEANLRKDKIINEAKEEARKRLEYVQNEIEQEVIRSNNEIHNMIVDIAFMAAKAIVKEDIDHEKYLRLVNQIIDEAIKKWL